MDEATVEAEDLAKEWMLRTLPLFMINLIIWWPDQIKPINGSPDMIQTAMKRLRAA